MSLVIKLLLLPFLLATVLCSAQNSKIQLEATFDGELIVIPITAVGDKYYKIALKLMESADVVDVEVTEATEINPLNGSGASTFDSLTGVLHIPSLMVDNNKYWANFSLIKETPVVFRFTGAGLIGDANKASVEKGQGIFTGYLSMNISAPQSYGYGFSIYSNTTFLFDEVLAFSQVGLPSSWITPYNLSLIHI